MIGTLNTTTPSIAGTYNSLGAAGGSGTFTASRAAKDPFDVPPVITVNVPLTNTVQLGTNVTLSLVVTGSPPLCYQWYSNNVVIPNATTNKLIIDKCNMPVREHTPLRSTIRRAKRSRPCHAGCRAQTTPPTNQITAPTPGLKVYTAAYTITGKASDNVRCRTCGVGSTIKAGISKPAIQHWSDWSAQVTLTTPGENTIHAYAVDTSGNVSASI